MRTTIVKIYRLKNKYHLTETWRDTANDWYCTGWRVQIDNKINLRLRIHIRNSISKNMSAEHNIFPVLFIEETLGGYIIIFAPTRPVHRISRCAFITEIFLHDRNGRDIKSGGSDKNGTFKRRFPDRISSTFYHAWQCNRFVPIFRNIRNIRRHVRRC